LRLLAVGDSIIDGVGTAHVDESLPGQFAIALSEELNRRVHWRIEGQTGYTIEDVLDCLASIEDDHQADILLLSVGVNNVTSVSTTSYWRSKMKQLMDDISRKYPDARVLFAGLPPMSQFPLPPQPLRFSLGLRAATLDEIAAAVIADYPNATHVPTRITRQEHGFCEDGFHPSSESCNLWARELAVIGSRRETT